MVNNDQNDLLIICRDFNLMLNPDIDCQNYQHKLETNYHIENQELVNIFTYKNSKLKRYTWYINNPVKQERLDMFLISKTLIEYT